MIVLCLMFYLLEIVSYYCCASIPFSEVNLDTKSGKQAFQRSQNLRFSKMIIIVDTFNDKPVLIYRQQ